MVRTSPPTALLLNGVVMSAAFAGLEGCVVACIVISAAIVCPSLAYQANAYLYLFFCVGTFAAPGVLAYTGAKRGMVVGMFCYSLYTAAFLLPRPEVILPASAIAGFAGAVLWTAQGEYFTANALAYAVARSAAAGPLPRLSRAASVRGRGGAPKQQGVISSSGAIGLFAALFAGLFPIFLLLGKLSGSVLREGALPGRSRWAEARRRGPARRGGAEATAGGGGEGGGDGGGGDGDGVIWTPDYGTTCIRLQHVFVNCV